MNQWIPGQKAASQDRKAEWGEFIFDGNVPATVGKNLFVHANHFSSDCFTDRSQFNAGLATKLFLKEESISRSIMQTGDM